MFVDEFSGDGEKGLVKELFSIKEGSGEGNGSWLELKLRSSGRILSDNTEGELKK